MSNYKIGHLSKNCCGCFLGNICKNRLLFISIYGNTALKSQSQVVDTNSVIRFCEISPKRHYFGRLWQFLEGSCVTLQKKLTYLANWLNFHCCMTKYWTNNAAIWSHWTQMQFHQFVNKLTGHHLTDLTDIQRRLYPMPFAFLFNYCEIELYWLFSNGPFPACLSLCSSYTVHSK